MAIRLVHQPTGIGGLAAYAAGQGKARERQSKNTLDLLKALQERDDRYRLQQNAQRFDLALEARRSERDRLARLHGHRLTMEREEERDARRADFDADRRRWWDTRDRSRADLDVAASSSAALKKRVDDIRKTSGGSYAGGFGDIMSDLDAKILKISEDPKLSPADKHIAQATAYQDVLNKFDPAVHMEGPGDFDTALGVQTDPVTGIRYGRKGDYEPLATPGDNSADFAKMQSKAEDMLRAQADADYQRKVSARNTGDPEIPEPSYDFSADDIAKQMRAIDDRNAKVRSLYQQGQPTFRPPASGTTHQGTPIGPGSSSAAPATSGAATSGGATPSDIGNRLTFYDEPGEGRQPIYRTIQRYGPDGNPLPLQDRDISGYVSIAPDSSTTTPATSGSEPFGAALDRTMAGLARPRTGGGLGHSGEVPSVGERPTRTTSAPVSYGDVYQDQFMPGGPEGGVPDSTAIRGASATMMNLARLFPGAQSPDDIPETHREEFMRAQQILDRARGRF